MTSWAAVDIAQGLLPELGLGLAGNGRVTTVQLGVQYAAAQSKHSNGQLH
jgi:hypothetical protein